MAEGRVEGRRDNRETYVRSLDYLQYGHPSDDRPVYQKRPLVQGVGEDFFVLLEFEVKEGYIPQSHERIYVGDGERDVVERIKRRVHFNDLSNTAKNELAYVLEEIVQEQEERFIDFFNRSQPITTRMHTLELLPGIGKKMMWALIEERERKPFSGFKDISGRVKGLHNPLKLITRRIEEELKEDGVKYRLFTR